MLRPIGARWLEVLCGRGDAVRTLAILAATGAVEVEVRRAAVTDFPLRDLVAGLADYERLRLRYERYWQRGRLRLSPLVGAPRAVLDLALARLAVWRREADPLIDALQASEEELTRLRQLAEIIGRLGAGQIDFALLAQAGPVLGTFCAILPGEAEPRLPASLIARSVPWEDGRCYLFLGADAAIAEARRQVTAVKGRLIERPSWLAGQASEARAQVLARCRFLSVRIVHLYAELDSLFEDHALGDVLGEAAWLAWFGQHVGVLEREGEHLAWITGWTDDLTGRSLSLALERHRSRALLRLVPPPAGTSPPQLLMNPRWLRPFELFARTLGVPGADEADPTPVLAVVVPLLFGYMFGDVGQGLVLVALGWWLRDRFEAARLLILCGGSAMVFGLAFGSLFAREELIPALWLHPLAEPATVLLVPLAFGAGLLSLGQVLAGLGAARRGALGDWLRRDAGFLALYLGLLGWLASPANNWLPWPGLVWYLVGAVTTHDDWRGRLAAIGHLVEAGFQIFVNTLSFARVGAFALAHAALSTAVVTMADAVPASLGLLVLVLGNLVLIALEGLIVSIQTTRLVLFEFFNRFLQGTGRVFRPLPPPPAVVGAAG